MEDEDLTIVVAIPTYNNEDTVGDTLEMVFDQHRLPDRVVFCDKSEDDTRERIKEYQDQDNGVSVEIIDQHGDGVADAYNEILSYVCREYDLFVTLQSDLVVDEDWLMGHERVHAEHPEIDIVNGDNKSNNPTDREVEPDERPYYVGRNFSAKAGTLESIDGWDSNFLRGEDWDMRIRLAGQNVRAYARTDLGYTWQKEDPYITLSKAKRRPTAATFFAKYGRWYLWFHPSHVVSDSLSVVAVVFGILGLGCLPFLPFVGALLLSAMLVVIGVYTATHNLLRGGVDDKHFVGPIRKQFLNGLAVLYAIQRITDDDTEWNMSGFDPDNIPRYKF